jgi:hypothetical protein
MENFTLDLLLTQLNEENLLYLGLLLQNFLQLGTLFWHNLRKPHLETVKILLFVQTWEYYFLLCQKDWFKVDKREQKTFKKKVTKPEIVPSLKIKTKKLGLHNEKNTSK